MEIISLAQINNLIMKTTLLSFLFVFTCLNMVNAQDVKSHYKIANRIHIDSNGSWDYTAVDEQLNRLYVSHGTMVQVVDLNAAKVIATIPNTLGVHGIALANDLHKGFISDGKDSSVTIFDLKTNATIAKIQVTGEKPDAIVYDDITKRVFTMNGKTNNATVIDAKTNTVVGTIPLDGKPEFCVADGAGKLYVNIEDKSTIAEIDASAMKVLRQWSIAPGEGPSGLAMDKKNRRLFSVCDKMMVVSDADKGSVVTTVTIGDGPDAAAFDPILMRVYSSNSDGTLTVVSDSADTYKVLENVETQKRARTMALNTKTHHIYLPTAEFMPLYPVRAGAEKPKPKPKPGTFQVLDVEPLDIKK
jgi:YVTN family beta-propeller protein